MATVTEVAALTVVYAVFIRVLFYKDLSFKSFLRSCAESASASAVVLILIQFSSALSWLLTIQEAPQRLAQGMLNSFDSRELIILALILLLIVTGMFIDIAPAILLLTPVLMPLAKAIDMNLIHLGLIMVVVLAVGLYTPPVGTTLYISAGIGRVPTMEVVRELFPFYGLMVIMIILTAYFPHLLFIPTG